MASAVPKMQSLVASLEQLERERIERAALEVQKKARDKFEAELDRGKARLKRKNQLKERALLADESASDLGATGLDFFSDDRAQRAVERGNIASPPQGILNQLTPRAATAEQDVLRNTAGASLAPDRLPSTPAGAITGPSPTDALRGNIVAFRQGAQPAATNIVSPPPQAQDSGVLGGIGDAIGGFFSRFGEGFAAGTAGLSVPAARALQLQNQIKRIQIQQAQRVQQAEENFPRVYAELKDVLKSGAITDRAKQRVAALKKRGVPAEDIDTGRTEADVIGVLTDLGWDQSKVDAIFLSQNGQRATLALGILPFDSMLKVKEQYATEAAQLRAQQEAAQKELLEIGALFQRVQHTPGVGNPYAPGTNPTTFEPTTQLNQLAQAGGVPPGQAAATLTGGQTTRQGDFIPPMSVPEIKNPNYLRFLQEAAAKQAGQLPTKASAGERMVSPDVANAVLSRFPNAKKVTAPISQDQLKLMVEAEKATLTEGGRDARAAQKSIDFNKKLKVGDDTRRYIAGLNNATRLATTNMSILSRKELQESAQTFNLKRDTSLLTQKQQRDISQSVFRLAEIEAETEGQIKINRESLTGKGLLDMAKQASRQANVSAQAFLKHAMTVHPDMVPEVFDAMKDKSLAVPQDVFDGAKQALVNWHKLANHRTADEEAALIASDPRYKSDSARRIALEAAAARRAADDDEEGSAALSRYASFMEKKGVSQTVNLPNEKSVTAELQNKISAANSGLTLTNELTNLLAGEEGARFAGPSGFMQKVKNTFAGYARDLKLMKPELYDQTYNKNLSSAELIRNLLGFYVARVLAGEVGNLTEKEVKKSTLPSSFIFDTHADAVNALLKTDELITRRLKQFHTEAIHGIVNPPTPAQVSDIAAQLAEVRARDRANKRTRTPTQYETLVIKEFIAQGISPDAKSVERALRGR